MASMKMTMVALAIVLMSWTTTTTTTQAQQGPGTCIQALIPCGPFLGTPNPPATCCDPLKEAVKNDLACLCAAFANPALAATYNMTQATQLPSNCGITNAGPSLCTGGISSPPTSSPGASAPLASGPSSPTTPSTSTPSETTTPSTSASSPGSPPPSGNDAGRCIVPVSSVMLLVAGLMFFY